MASDSIKSTVRELLQTDEPIRLEQEIYIVPRVYLIKPGTNEKIELKPLPEPPRVEGGSETE